MVIKIGTGVITATNGFLDLKIMKNIVSQIIKLKDNGWQVAVVSSGAMGAGRSLIKNIKCHDSVSCRQVLASVGQAKLMSVYTKLFGPKNLCAQVLATKEDFKDQKHYNNMRNCFEALLRQGVVPIVNENDVVAVSELMFTDNDELAGLIGAMLKVDELVILSVVDGLYMSDQKTIIKEIDAKTKWQQAVRSDQSIFGRGGMKTKAKIARKLALMGIEVNIVNGRKNNILLDLILLQKSVGTRFVSLRNKKVSGLKNRLSFMPVGATGSVWVDQVAEKILLSGRPVSLLPVGAIKLQGNFKKGDLIKIKNSQGREIGLGMAQYDYQTAQENLGHKNKKELIHYNYLLINL